LKHFGLCLSVALLFCGSWDVANAQSIYKPATQAFATCLLKNTNGADNINLIRWMFTVTAFHPDVKDLTQIDADDIKLSNEKMGAYFNRLIIENCPSEARLAYKENPNAMFDAFKVVGEQAGRGLMSHEMVNEQMIGFTSEIDIKGVQRVFEDKN